MSKILSNMRAEDARKAARTTGDGSQGSLGTTQAVAPRSAPAAIQTSTGEMLCSLDMSAAFLNCESVLDLDDFVNHHPSHSEINMAWSAPGSVGSQPYGLELHNPELVQQDDMGLDLFSPMTQGVCVG